MKNIALLASHPHRTYTQHYIGVGSIEYPTRNIVFAFVKCRNLLFCASFSGYERVSDSFTWSVLFCISIDRFGCYSGLDPYNYYPNQPFRCFIFPQNKKKTYKYFILSTTNHLMRDTVWIRSSMSHTISSQHYHKGSRKSRAIEILWH